MELQKAKNSFLTAVQKLSSELHKKSVKAKPRAAAASNVKLANTKSMISISNAPVKKKPKQSIARVDKARSTKIVPTKSKRTHSLEGKYDDRIPSGNKPKRNNSLIETKLEEAEWDASRVPYTPAVVIRLFAKHLTYFEQSEILSYRNIYYIASDVKKIEGSPKKVNDGFDDERNDYVLIKNDHICFRYEILDILGRGSYGQVIKAYDHKDKRLVAVKVIRNLACIMHQAKIEIQILYKLLQPNEGSKYVIQILEHFIFRNHICLTFDLLDMNLYQLIKSKPMNPLSTAMIKSFTLQILQGIKFYHSLDILHCDLKPENIMLTNDKASVKVIDFGSGCFSNKRVFTYIQSRFYRAPEVILEAGYDNKIDIWSLGCVVAELVAGKPLFTGRDEVEQLVSMVETLGSIPNSMLERSPKKFLVLDAFKKYSVSPKYKPPGNRSLKSLFLGTDPLLIDFLHCNSYIGCLTYEPSQRPSSEDCLSHDWFSHPNFQHNSSLPTLKIDRILRASSSKKTYEDYRATTSKKKSFLC